MADKIEAHANALNLDDDGTDKHAAVPTRDDPAETKVFSLVPVQDNKVRA